MDFDKLEKELQLIKASLKVKKVPDADHDKLDENGKDKMKHASHMNGKNVEQYDHDAEKKLRDRGVNVAKQDDEGPDDATKDFLANWEPATKHPTEPTTGMPPGKKKGERKTSTGFKMKLVKALDEAGHRDSALLLQNWGELDKTAEEFMKSNYGPKDMGLYNPTDNIKRKKSRTGEVVEDAGRNTGVRNYTTSGSSVQSAREAAENKEQAENTKASTRTLADMSDEEKKALEAKYGVKVKPNLNKSDLQRFEDRKEFEEALAKPVEGMQDVLSKRAPKGVDADAICTSAMKKNETLEQKIKRKKEQYKDIDTPMEDPMKVNTRIAVKDLERDKMKKDDAPHEPESPEDSAHDVVEEDDSLMEELMDLDAEGKKAMLAHLREYKKDPEGWKRSKENKKKGKK
jgi:hypothetical protein